MEGAPEVVLFGETIKVRAQIHNLEGFSGHADRDGLITWLKGFEKSPHDIFIVHGEPEVKIEFAATVKSELGWNCTVVDGYNEYELKEVTSVFTVCAGKGIRERRPDTKCAVPYCTDAR